MSDHHQNQNQNQNQNQGQDQNQSPSGVGRLFTGVAWVALLLGLWLWGREGTDLRPGVSGPATGDMAAAGRPPRVELPPAHRPLGEAPPQRLDIPGLDVRAPVVARGLDGRGALDPPPFDRPGTVGWYADGVTPGASGTALVVGHVDTETRPAVFYKVSTLRPGQKIRVVRADAEVAEFTVEDIQVLPRDGFDARQAYGPRRSGRAELRLVTCGGSFDEARHRYTANVIVSAYLTDTTT
ncbi:class F sortase [Streptomyces sp. NWU339]|uniref:class F sortase n=1 Tax=Streptomyces sp. NWU339 TaxID=2185284 RepID=UPI000D67866B|nr:class F sortase [Streptomyces sp. NWU339]PWI07809.1 class F sortase [Streptomyces sp. NWU339]